MVSRRWQRLQSTIHMRNAKARTDQQGGIAAPHNTRDGVEPRHDGQLVVDRRDDPSAHLDDPRHDPVLRGLQRGAELFDAPLQKGLSVIVEGTIPRGTGMGTISAGYAAVNAGCHWDLSH